MTRVLVLIPDHNYGGEELRASNIFSFLRSQGHDVWFATSRTDFSVPRDRLIQSRWFNRVLLLPLISLYVAYLVWRHRIQVVLLFKRQSAVIGWLLQRVLPSTRWVFNVANAWPDKTWLWNLVPDELCALSSMLVPDHVAETKLVTEIPIGCAVLGSSEIETKSALDAKELRLVSAGKLSVQKRHVKLLEVAAELGSRGYDVRVVIAGDGPLRRDLLRYADYLSVKLELLGRVEKMSSFYEQGGIYTQTSLYEGLPNSLLEAGHFFLPIVANDVGATKSLINENTGYLVESEEICDYVSAIENVINNPELSYERSKALKQYILSNHSMEGMLKRYHSLVSEPSAR